MPEVSRRSALENYPEAVPGIREVRCRSIVQINGAPKDLHIRLKDWGFESEARPLKAVAGADARLLWSAPDQYLLTSESRTPLDLLATLETQLGDSGATAVDLSHARTVIELSGLQVRDILAKGCPLDVDAMQPGDCAPCLLAHFNVLLYCQAPRTFQVLVFRSFGLACMEWLAHAAAEFQA